MNNKTLTIINLTVSVFLIAAVIYLFTAKSSSVKLAEPSDNVSDTEIMSEDDTVKVDRSALMGTLKVVYINTDTLWEKYEFVSTTLKGLEREQTRLQSSYETKMIKLEKDYSDYLQKGKANQLSLKQQQDIEASLEKQQLEIKKLEDEVTKKLIVRKQELNQQINDTIQAFLNRYRIDNNYDLILQHSYLNGILSGTPDIDITKDVVRKINGEYKKFKMK
jgi:outer membrane protein